MENRCACAVVNDFYNDVLVGSAITYCPLHAAARELLEALQYEHKLVDPECGGRCKTAKLISRANRKRTQ